MNKGKILWLSISALLLVALFVIQQGSLGAVINSIAANEVSTQTLISAERMTTGQAIILTAYPSVNKITPSNSNGYPPPEKLTAQPVYASPTPLPTQIPLPTITIELAREIKGSGDFPSMPFLWHASDKRTAALYEIIGDTAYQRAVFEGFTQGDVMNMEISPDEQSVAIVLKDDEKLLTYLYEVNIHDGQKVLISQGRGRTDLTDKTAPIEEILSTTWLDNKSLLFVKKSWPAASVKGENAEDPQQREIWISSLDGKDQRLLVKAPVKRVLGVSPDGKRLYVTRVIDQDWQLEGFSLLEIETGEMENLWPAEDQPDPYYYDVQLLKMPNGSARVIYTNIEQGPGTTVFTHVPTTWIGDPETRQTEILWSGEAHGIIHKDKSEYSTYDIPYVFLPSPDQDGQWIYVLYDEIWQMDNEHPTSKQERIAAELDNKSSILDWSSKGIVILDNQADQLQWLGKDWQVQGKIKFSGNQNQMEENNQIFPQVTRPTPTFNLDYPVPYIHQLWDTSDWFDGHYSCGPTSAVMALAYYKRLKPHKITVSNPYSHNSEFGWYITTDSQNCSSLGTCAGYTFHSACNDPQDVIFDETAVNNPDGQVGRPKYVSGAFGACTNNGNAFKDMIQSYLEKHDLGVSFGGETGAETASESDIRAELDGGAIVILGTYLTGEGGHIVIVRGYTQETMGGQTVYRYRVNDPFGHKINGTYDNCTTDNVICGADVLYTWDEFKYSNYDNRQKKWVTLEPYWYRSVYAPQFLPDIKGDSGRLGNVNIQNGSSWTGSADVCFMNSTGTRIYKEHVSIGAWKEYTVPWNSNSSVSAIVIPHQTSMASNVSNRGLNNLNLAGAYKGIVPNEASRSIYVPLLLHARTTASGQGNSQIVIQNTQSITTMAKMRFYDSSGNLSFDKSIIVSPYGNYTYQLNNLPSEWVGSAKISTNDFGNSSSAYIAVTYDVTSYSNQTWETFNGFKSDDKTNNWFVPEFISRRNTMTGNISTPANVQNLSGTTIPAGGVVLNCSPAEGSGFSNLSVSNPSAIPDSAAYSFNPIVDFTNFPSGWIGTCQVSSDYPVVVIVQIRCPESSNPGSNNRYLASGYNAIPANGTSRQVFFPVIQKRLIDGRATSILVQNLNMNSSASVTFYYKASCSGCNDYTVGPYSIPPGGSINHNHRVTGVGLGSGQHDLPDGWYGTLQVVSSDQYIDGFEQMTKYIDIDGDSYTSANAILLP